jgi:HEAT repeat protein
MHIPEPISPSREPSAGLKSSINRAIQRLLQGDFHERWEAAKQLTRWGEAVIEPLVALLAEEDDEDVFWFVARILGDLQHPDAISALVDLVGRSVDQPDVALAAALGLANSGAMALPALRSLLAQPPTRTLAATALARLQGVEVMDLLVPLAADEDSSIRAMALEALAASQSTPERLGQAQVLLVEALGDLASPVRIAALSTLTGRLRSWPCSERAALAGKLAALLTDLNPDVIRQAAIALGRLEDPAAVQALIAGIGLGLPVPLHTQLLRSLSWQGTPKALAVLEDQLRVLHRAKDPESQFLSRDLVLSLGRMEGESLRRQVTVLLLDFLGRHAETISDRLREAIALSLGYLGDSLAVEPLLNLLTDPVVGVRMHAIAGLKHLCPQGPEDLRQWALRQPDVNAATLKLAQALQAWSEPERPR